MCRTFVKVKCKRSAIAAPKGIDFFPQNMLPSTQTMEDIGQLVTEYNKSILLWTK